MQKSQYNSVAVEYDKRRPGYLKQLVDALISHTGITTKSKLLEIGAGTGKATVPLAQKGYDIDCIEIEPKMAEILKDKCNNLDVSVIVDNFETWENLKGTTYDLIYSAQAFHWIDEKIKYKKCNNLLNSNGKMALIWYFSVIEPQESFDRLNAIFSKYNTGFSCSGIKDSYKYFDRERNKLENTNYFTNVQELKFEGKIIKQNADEFINRYNTTSAFASLDEQTQIRVNNELRQSIDLNGGSVNSKNLYGLYIVDKV